MQTKPGADHSWEAIRAPRVFIFIVTGVVVIFLTFLTDNNAIEIAISGIASVFIGIGVNNFTSLQGKQEDRRLEQQRGQYASKVLDLMDIRTRHAREAADWAERAPVRTDLDEIEQLISLLRQILVEDRLDD